MVIGSLVSVFAKDKIHGMFLKLQDKNLGIWGIIPACILGILSPLCMYGTIPIAASFSEKGVVTYMKKKMTETIILLLMVSLLMACGNIGEKNSEEVIENTKRTDNFTLKSTVGEVLADPAFGYFGRLLFPVDRNVSEDMTLEEVSSGNIYVWYTDIQADKTVEIINTLKANAESGVEIYYPIYTEEEIDRDAAKQDTGLFFFQGNPGEKYAIMNAGGGFMYVGAMHDSIPHALEVSKMGYNCFALIYRLDYAYEDLATAITYINDHADELGVDPEGYSLWGGSAGARMAATLGNSDYLEQLTGRTDISQASAVVMQYTGYTEISEHDAPTYACVGTSDGIANWETMKMRLDSLSSLGIPTEFHSYEGLSHGFGLGTGTVAEGWIEDAVRFWKHSVKTKFSQS